MPFHMWTPDAYEGAPTPVTGFMAAVVKAAAFAALFRCSSATAWAATCCRSAASAGAAASMVMLAAITITVGNIAALRQENIKRMLAYSSISHGGVILVGLSAMGLGASTGQTSLLYYLIAYSLTTMGAFAVVAFVGSRDNERLSIDDWAGLASKHPAAALAMTVCLLSLGGMPPTGGFFAKFYIFKSALEAHDQQLLWLVVIGVVNSAISIYYYLRIVTAMYFRDPRGKDTFAPSRSGALAFVMVVCPLVILEMGVLPGFWLKLGL